MNFSFIGKTSQQIQDIWKDGKFSNHKPFQEPVFKAVKNRKTQWLVDRQQVRSINRNLFFSFWDDDDNYEWSQQG